MDPQLLIVAKSIKAVQAGGVFDSGKREYRLWWAWSDADEPVLPEKSGGILAGMTGASVADHGSGVVWGQSLLFTGVDAQHPVNIEGGIPLYGPRYSGKALSLVAGLIEIDENYASVAAEIEKARSMGAVQQVIDFLARGTLGPLVTFIDYLPAIFKKVGEDDNHGLGVFNAWEIDNYGFEAGKAVAERKWQIRSQKAVVEIEAKLFSEDASEELANVA